MTEALAVGPGLRQCPPQYEPSRRNAVDSVDFDALEHQAHAKMPPASFAFCAAGADDEISVAENISDWRRLRLRPRVLRSVDAAGSRVGVVTGGGSGHEPAFLGYVGPGLLDAVAVGEVFASPTARSFHGAFRAADGGTLLLDDVSV